MYISRSKQFTKQIAKAPNKVRLAALECFELFIENDTDPQLHNHSLSGKWHGCRSIDITGNWRAIFEMCAPDHTYFVAFGTHLMLYG